MHKKLMLACMAIAASAAFVTAPVASASPVLTESGNALAVGASLKGTNTGSVLFTSGIKVECAHAELSGTVSKNSGFSVAAGMGKVLITGPVGGPCTSGVGSADWTMTSPLCWETISGDKVSMKDDLSVPSRSDFCQQLLRVTTSTGAFLQSENRSV